MKALRGIEGIVLGAIMLAMSFAYTFNVGVRELAPAFAPQLAWIEELCLFGLVWMIFLGLGLGLEGGRHIAMRMVLTRMPPASQRAAKLVINLAGLVFCGLSREDRRRHHDLRREIGSDQPDAEYLDALALYRHAGRLRPAGAALPAGDRHAGRPFRRPGRSGASCVALRMIVLALIVLAVGLLIAGAEIFLVIGIPAVLAKHIFHPHMPDLIIGQRVVGGVEVVTLLAIPFFVFASDLMARGRMAAQLAELFRALVGHYRGGIGHSTVVTCMVFGAAAGSAPATVAAMGRLSFPELKRAGFSEKFSLGLIASSAECALLIPPSITFVVYSWLTGTSIAALFAAGLVIGIVLGLAFMVLVALEAWRVGAAVGERYSGAAQWKAFRDAFWALLMQVILLVGIFSGVFTATEAAAVSVVYAIGVEALIFRAFGWREVFDIAKDSAISTGVIFILLAMGALLAFFITLSGVDRAVLALVREVGVNWVVFMMIVNIVFLTCAMFLDPNSIMVIFLPTMFPIAAALGIDPVHFGMVVTLNVCTGMIMPPLGLDLAVAASTLNRPMEAVVAGIWPFILTNVAVLILISYIPPLSTFLPRVFGV